VIKEDRSTVINQEVIRNEESPALQEIPLRNRVPWPMLLVATLFVVVAFLSWYGSWFGRPLSDSQIESYLKDQEKPRNAQHALAFIAERMAKGDHSMSRWYPAVIAARLPPCAGLLCDVLPDLPRSSAVFGRDSTVAIYVEAYGQGPRLPVYFSVRNDKGAQLWHDSVSLARRGALFSGIVSVPISAVGVGTAKRDKYGTRSCLPGVVGHGGHVRLADGRVAHIHGRRLRDLAQKLAQHH